MAKSTYFFDIFGTVLSHHGHHDPNAPHPATPGSKEKLEKLHNEGHKIVLMTSHGDSDRTWIVHALHKAGISYDHLLLDAGHGVRHLVDDKGAKAVHVKTNEGLGNVNL